MQYINFSPHIPIVSGSLYPILHVEDKGRDYWELWNLDTVFMQHWHNTASPANQEPQPLFPSCHWKITGTWGTSLTLLFHLYCPLKWLKGDHIKINVLISFVDKLITCRVLLIHVHMYKIYSKSPLKPLSPISLSLSCNLCPLFFLKQGLKRVYHLLLHIPGTLSNTLHYLVNKFKSCFPWSLYPVFWLYWVQIILQDYDSVGSLNDSKDWSFSLDLLTWPCDLTTNLWSINLNDFQSIFCMFW